MRGGAGGSGAADIAAEIVRRHISHHAERKALDILQIDKARRASGIQVRKPLSVACDDPRLKAALIAMENSSDGSLQIAELARRVGLSRRQLERLFVAQLHTPAAIYRRLRLDRARQLLVLLRSPLTEIAFDLGFDNVSHFTRLFNRIYGVPPGQFRSKAQGARADPGLSSRRIGLTVPMAARNGGVCAWARTVPRHKIPPAGPYPLKTAGGAASSEPKSTRAVACCARFREMPQETR